MYACLSFLMLFIGPFKKSIIVKYASEALDIVLQKSKLLLINNHNNNSTTTTTTTDLVLRYAIAVCCGSEHRISVDPADC